MFQVGDKAIYKDNFDKDEHILTIVEITNKSHVRVICTCGPHHTFTESIRDIRKLDTNWDEETNDG